MKKRLICLMLSLMMVITLLPTSALAEELKNDPTQVTDQGEPQADPAPAADPEPVPVLPGTTATVWSANGKPVKLRNKPTTGSSMYDMVPINTVVTVDEYGEKWCRVSYGYRRGWYMMTEYLTWG